MPDFVEPKRVSVPIDEAFRTLLPVGLTKDLHDNEAICPVCHGLGLRVVDNAYGLSDDPNKSAGQFPYKHQSLIFCPNCYNGVVHICPDCGKQIPKGYGKCNCPAEQARQREKRKQQYQEALQKAEKHDSCTLGGRFQYAYCDWIHYNDGFFSDWGEFFEAWHDFVAEREESGIPVPERPEYVWGTELIEMQLDASDIAERACEDMYEDATVSDSAIKELQDYLDTWKYRYGPTTYGEDRRHAIKIPWEEDTE